MNDFYDENDELPDEIITEFGDMDLESTEEPDLDQKPRKKAPAKTPVKKK